MGNLGPTTEAALQDPIFKDIMWKMTPASMAVRLTNGQYKTWHYIQLLSRKLVDVAVGRCKRLIVCMPPRAGKSEMVSKWFPTWYLENFPERKFILATYEADFAAKWGGRVRDLIMENQDTLSVRLKGKTPAMHHFETEQNGSMSTAGVGGPLTGKGANVLVIDDFCKNSEEANSRVIRNKTWDWWLSTARTRIEPFMDPKTGKKVDPAVIIMATRWHSDDLIGRLVNPAFSSDENVREGWEVFVFPAAAEPEAEQHYKAFGVKVNDLRMESLSGKAFGDRLKILKDQLMELKDPEWRDVLGRKKGEPLCPERFNEKDLAMFKSGSLKDWYALYQQRPGDQADDGNVYYQFDPPTHLKNLSRDDNMQLFVSMDFNVDPMCLVIGQIDRGYGQKVLVRCEILEEIILPNSNTPSMMFKLMQELQKYKQGYTLSLEIYGDAAGTQRSSSSQKTNWQLVNEYLALDTTLHYTFKRRKANPTIVDRVNAVNAMLRAADGSVRLYVDASKCNELVKDFQKVKWQLDSGGNSTGLLDKSNKERTHISDGLGYAIEYNFSLKAAGGARRGLMR